MAVETKSPPFVSFLERLLTNIEVELLLFPPNLTGSDFSLPTRVEYLPIGGALVFVLLVILTFTLTPGLVIPDPGPGPGPGPDVVPIPIPVPVPSGEGEDDRETS